ncbi:hypothetical protein [Guggenheimella bovis]
MNSKLLRILYFLIIIVLVAFAFYIKGTHPSSAEMLERYENMKFELTDSQEELTLSEIKPDLVMIGEEVKILSLAQNCTVYELSVEKVLAGDKSLEGQTITYFEPIYISPNGNQMISLAPGYTPIQKNQKYVFSLYRYSDYREGLFTPEDKTGIISPFCKVSLENKEVLVNGQFEMLTKKELENVEFIANSEAQKEDFYSKKKDILKSFGLPNE